MPTAMQAEHSKHKNAQREYLEKIKPYVEAKTKIFALAKIETKIRWNGTVETNYTFDKETKDTLHNIDVAIFKELETFRRSY